MKNSILLLAISSILIVSCNTKDETKPVGQKSKTKTELITAHYWKLTALKSVASDNPSTIIDVYALKSACDKDDIQKFNTNGTVIYDQGASKCISSDPQTTTETWSFNSNETAIIFQGGSESNLQKLSETELVLFWEYEDNGVTYSFTETYSKN